jgi:hypothetical protein
MRQDDLLVVLSVGYRTDGRAWRYQVMGLREPHCPVREARAPQRQIGFGSLILRATGYG